MLLEYTVDTVDEKIGPSAVEIRRRFAERALKTSEVSTDTLTFCKEKNREQRKHHVDIDMTVHESFLQGRVSLARSEHHLVVSQGIHRLDRDIGRAARLSKSKSDSLTDLQQKIISMRKTLNLSLDKSSVQVPDEHADMIVAREFRAGNNSTGKYGEMERLYLACPKCGKQIVKEFISQHTESCQGGDIQDTIGIYNIDYFSITPLTTATFPPQPPRGVLLVLSSCSSIRWKWRPPINDGGLPVFQYEIRYLIKYSEYNVVTSRYVKWEEEVPSLLTSNWCIRLTPRCADIEDGPVCHFGYKMVGLRAATEYCNFQIRCHNLHGPSDWIDMLPPEAPSVFTLDSVASTEPLFFTCEKVTATTMHVSWSPPFFDGGTEVVAYTIHYTVIEIAVTVTARGVPIDHIHKFSVEGSESSAVIRNILSDSDVKDVFITATNKAGLVSKRGHLQQKVVHTNTCCRHTVLSKEIDRALALKVPFVESSLLTGVPQRLNRVDYIRKLSDELSVTHPEEQELAERREWEAVKEIRRMRQQVEEEKMEKERLEAKMKQTPLTQDGNDDDEEEDKLLAVADKNKEEHAFGVRKRREHFKTKIEALEKLQESLQKENEAIDANRTKLTQQMKELQPKLTDVRLESERVNNIKGEFVTSDVLQGTPMQYKTSDIRTKLNRAVQIREEKLAEMKFAVVSGQERKKEIRVEMQKASAACQERRAAALFFEQQQRKAKSVLKGLVMGHDAGMDSKGKTVVMSGTERRQLLSKYFSELLQFADMRQNMRSLLTDVYLGLLLRMQRAGFYKWKTGRFFHLDAAASPRNSARSSARSSIASRSGKRRQRRKNDVDAVSMGGVLLKQCETKRIELQSLLRDTLISTGAVKQKLHLTSLAPDTRDRLTHASKFKEMQEGFDLQKIVEESNMRFLLEGDGCAQENKFERAKQLYDAQIISIRARTILSKGSKRKTVSIVTRNPQLTPKEIKLLAVCHGRLGKVYLSLSKPSRAIIEFDRQLSLGKEISDQVEEAEAYFGLGSGYLSTFDYDNALRYLYYAKSRFEHVGNIPRYCGTLRVLSDCYSRLNKPVQAAEFKAQYEELEDELRSKLSTIDFKLNDLRARLIATTAAEMEHVVQVERSSLQMLRMKEQMKDFGTELDSTREEQETQREVIKAVEDILQAIQEAMIQAVESDETEMYSDLVHDQAQVVEIEELKTRLMARSKLEGEKLKAESETLRQLNVKESNLRDSMNEMDQQLMLEEGALATRSRVTRPFRAVALCAANAAGNEVTGTGSGGYEQWVAAEVADIHFIDYHNGQLCGIIAGGKSRDSATLQSENEAKKGHDGTITCLLHDGGAIFSGSTDEKIICWEYSTHNALYAMTGHEGAIVSLASNSSYVASSSADLTIRLWMKHTNVNAVGNVGQQVRVVYGHVKSVLSLQLGESWMLSGSADFEVRVWTLSHSSKNSLLVDSTNRLKGHECPITCVSYGSLEVFSGDMKGRIFIWWMKTVSILRKCEVHNGPVKCMQFDAIHIVSGGADACVCITDIATGEKLQTLVGHGPGPVLGVAFDSDRIISIGVDNTMRYWQWGGDRMPPRDKYHILDKGESLATLCKLYSVSMDSLMRWNGIVDGRQYYVGMKLLVRKGNPSKPTDAERFADEKALKVKADGDATAKRLSKQGKIVGGLGNGEKLLSRINRVHMLATDIDFFSLGNRMFRNEKRQVELFPDRGDPNLNPHALSVRLQRDPKIEVARNIKKKGAAPVGGFYISGDNEEDWKAVAEELALTMLSLFVEYEAYAVVMEQKRKLRSKISIIGRINQYEKKKQHDEELKGEQNAVDSDEIVSDTQDGSHQQLTHGNHEEFPLNSESEPLKLPPLK